MANDFYSVLGVSKDASQEEIQKAYLKLARKYHPDMNPDDPEGAKKKFQELQTAFDTLKDPEKRKQYDQFGDSYQQFSGANGPGFGGFGGFGNFGAGGGEFSFDSLDDILRAFGGSMGGAGARGSRRGARARNNAPVKGQNTRSDFTIDFKTSILGGKVALALRDSPTGKIKSVDVDVPCGVESGAKIKLRELGDPGINGGANGDLILTIRVQPHPFYTRDGNDLRARVPISLKEAAFGGKVDVPTPYGVATVKVPPGSTTGTKLRLKGYGVRGKSDKSKGASSESGNLYVVFEVCLPKTWSKEDLALLEKMKLDENVGRDKLVF